jgi:hypothetical protein
VYSPVKLTLAYKEEEANWLIDVKPPDMSANKVFPNRRYSYASVVQIILQYISVSDEHNSWQIVTNTHEGNEEWFCFPNALNTFTPLQKNWCYF